MKFLLEVDDDKAEALTTLLADLPYVRVQPFSSYKVKVLEDLRETVIELNDMLKAENDAKNAYRELNNAYGAIKEQDNIEAN